jgi:hypothetical protein
LSAIACRTLVGRAVNFFYPKARLSASNLVKEEKRRGTIMSYAEVSQLPVAEQGGWDTVVVGDVNPQFDLIPENFYTFRLVAAAPHKYRPGALNLRITIDNESEYRGRTIFESIPNPVEFSFAPKMVARLAQAMGIDPLPGETALPYLQRAASEGGKFGAPLTHYVGKDKATGEDLPAKEQVKLGKAKPAA